MKKGILLHEAADDVGVAVMDLKTGEQIAVVTLDIGATKAAIAAGEHVHVHNIKSLRWTASSVNLLEK